MLENEKPGRTLLLSFLSSLATFDLGGPAVGRVLLLLPLLAFAKPQGAVAAGSETLRRAHDLTVTVDSRWAGGAHGGYHPVRIRVANPARPRELVFRFIGQSNGESRLPTVERTVLVDQNSTLNFTLSIPLVAPESRGELRVYEAGRPLDQLTQNVAVAERTPGAVTRPSLLVIHPDPKSVNCDAFEAAVQSITGAAAAAAASGRTYWSGGSSGIRSQDFAVLAPVMLPDSWIDYTAVDLVAVPLATFDKLPPAVRSAILAWVETGGTLLVTQ